MTRDLKLHTTIVSAALLAIFVVSHFLTPEQLFVLNLAAVVAAFLGCSTFVLRYHFTTRGAWAHSAIGRNVMMLMGCLAAALGFILSVYIFGDYPFRRSIGASLYAAIGYAAWIRVVLQFRAQTPLRAPLPDTYRRRRATDRTDEEAT